MIGLYHPKGGTTGEFAIRWHRVGGESVPRLEVFSDAWEALQQFGDVLEGMAALGAGRPRLRFGRRSAQITEQSIVDLLLRCGLTDLTAYEQGTDR